MGKRFVKKQEDDPPAVVLKEPPRPQQFPPVVSASGTRSLAKTWADVLPADEVIKWQGQSRPPGIAELLTRLNNRLSIYPRMPRKGTNLSDLIVDTVFQLIKLAALAVLSIVMLVVNRLPVRRDVSGRASDARYALTDKACYVARMEETGLVDVLRVEIRKNMALGLGGGGISFAVGKTGQGADVPIGFMDIPDAEAVHAMILMLRESKV